MRTRRIGSITLGITLVLCGIVYLIREIFPVINIIFVLKFWPIVLVILGVEVLIENVLSREDEIHYKYDFPAIVMLALTLAFAMIMAGLEILVTMA